MAGCWNFHDYFSRPFNSLSVRIPLVLSSFFAFFRSPVPGVEKGLVPTSERERRPRQIHFHPLMGKGAVSVVLLHKFIATRVASGLVTKDHPMTSSDLRI